MHYRPNFFCCVGVNPLYKIQVGIDNILLSRTFNIFNVSDYLKFVFKQAIAVCKKYSMLVQANQNLKVSRNAKNCLMTILDEMAKYYQGDTGGVNAFFIPGERDKLQFPAVHKKNLQKEAHTYLPSWIFMGNEGDVLSNSQIEENFKIKDHRGARYEMIFESNNQSSVPENYRAMHLYRKKIISSIFEENTPFSKELLTLTLAKMKSMKEYIDPVSDAIDYIISCLENRAQQTLYLSDDFRRFPPREATSYMLLITNFVFSQKTIDRMKRIIHTDGAAHPNIATSYDANFGDYKVEISPMKPFDTQGLKWVDRDMELIQNAFLTPQKILWNSLNEWCCKTRTDHQMLEHKTRHGLMIAQEWLNIVYLLGFVVKVSKQQ